MMKVSRIVLTATLLIFLCSLPASAGWVTKDGRTDYTQHKFFDGTNYVEWPFDGMPDFDQKQDTVHWMNAMGVWNWCGPVATANCLWWFDSKFESIKMKSLPGIPVRPPAVSDHYSLVHALGGWDDHHFSNVIPFINALGNSLPGGIPAFGITARQCSTMIQNYLSSAAVNLWGHYSVTIVEQPDFEYIREQVEISQDVILLMGFWQEDPPGTGNWHRFGGHWVTVAGVDTNVEADPWISYSDPFVDNAELGFPGIVWDGWLTPHAPIPHAPTWLHNDAGNVSHDYYPIAGSGSPGGGISAEEYDIDYDGWINFQGQNTPERLESYQSDYNPNLPVHVEIEDLVVVCPKFDYGDLHMNYPTIDIESCGPAHPLTDKAWLGEQIDDEIQPLIYNNDQFDDGVVFHGLPWMPGTNVSVDVTVTTGPMYANESLYLNAWKDGNIDGDFDDGPDAINEDDLLNCSEWVIQDRPVTGAAGGIVWAFDFCDPGVFDLGTYELRIRFRLTSQPVGRFGYGGYWGAPPSNGWGTNDIDWVLGEVEDYAMDDMQLSVELMDFEAIPGDQQVTLHWTTASETDNDYFEILRDGAAAVQMDGAGTSASPVEYSWIDTDVSNGLLYHYELIAVNMAGIREEIAMADAIPEAPTQIVTEYALYQNFPNPFNAETQIAFDLIEAGHVSLKVYNLLGQEVATALDASLNAGSHTVSFNAAALSSGIYVYRIETNGFAAQKKMVLMK